MTSCRIRSIGNSGARSSGPTGCVRAGVQRRRRRLRQVGDDVVPTGRHLRLVEQDLVLVGHAAPLRSTVPGPRTLAAPGGPAVTGTPRPQPARSSPPPARGPVRLRREAGGLRVEPVDQAGRRVGATLLVGPELGRGRDVEPGEARARAKAQQVRLLGRAPRSSSRELAVRRVTPDAAAGVERDPQVTGGVDGHPVRRALALWDGDEHPRLGDRARAPDRSRRP